ncbi:MAG: ImmA/IrrE family metallo-endopeptidase [Oscillospiraceae bacterium]
MANNFFRSARVLRAEHPELSPSEICDMLSVRVMYEELPDRVKGFCFCAYGRKAIVINRDLRHDEIPFCIAHELGHALFHDKINYLFISDSTGFVNGKFEREADLFAAALLLDEKEIVLNESITTETISNQSFIPLAAVEAWLQNVQTEIK